MKATELRIGNIIFDPKRKDVDLDKLGKGIYHVSSWAIERHDSGYLELQPIPLTEEWLVKFGFEPNGVYKSMRLPIDKLTKESNRTFITVSVVPNSIETWIEIISKRGLSSNPTYEELQTSILQVTHVHELQNLYFALTGTEL